VNVIVVGGAGFVGSHLVDRLLSEGHAVDVIDDLSVGSLGNLAEARAAGGSLKIHHLDAASAECEAVIGMRRPEVIYLLAPSVRSDGTPSTYAHAFEVALAVLAAARRHGIPKIVVALPAIALHGHPPVRALPLKDGEIAELVPRGIRGVVAKSILELLVSYRDLHAVEFTALAMATVYGPRARPDSGVVAAFLHAVRSSTAPVIHGDGRQTRDLLFVDDAVDALARAAERGGGLVVNVGTGVQTSIADLWQQVAGRLGATVEATHAPARPDELTRFALSAVRARIHLGWSPWTDLDTGLARLVDGDATNW
jgi:UDP-glucose 4-epimerase